MEQQVLTGLLSRGVPKHIAQGMVANMIAESGLNPGINEIKPLVPGSRGGYGLNQWTGPRRRAFEAFARERGRAFDDLDTQLDFTLYELQGPEAKAWSAIQSAQDPIEAARLYSERFLRPGIPNMNKRLSEAARIAGLPAPQGGQTVQRSTMNAPPGLLGGSEPKPTFWDKIPGGLLSDPDRRARLAMAFEGMTLNPNQALIGALSEDVKDRRQTKAQEKAMNATVEWLKSQGRDDLAAAVSSGALTGSQAAQMAYQRPDPMEALNVERAQLEIEALRNPQGYQQRTGAELGLTGPQADMMFNVGPDGKITQVGGGGTTVNVDTQGQPRPELLGTQGLVAIPDPSVPQGFRVEPAPGSPMALELEKAEAAKGKAAEGRARAADVVIEDIGRFRSLVESAPWYDPATGFGASRLSEIGGTTAANAAELSQTIRANIGFDRLQQMREESPTGGALGQVAVQELQALQSVLGSLSQSQSREQLIENLNRLEKIYGEIVRKASAYPNADRYGFGGGAGTPTQTAPARITGDEEYNALPSGAQFIGPDGKLRRKP